MSGSDGISAAGFGFTAQTCLLRIYIAFVHRHLFDMRQAVEQVILKNLEGIPDIGIIPFPIS